MSDEVSKELNAAIQNGLFSAHCQCGKKLTPYNVKYQITKKGNKLVKLWMKDAGLTHNEAKNLTIGEFVNRLCK